MTNDRASPTRDNKFTLLVLGGTTVAYTKEFRTLVHQQLNLLMPVEMRPMFGGIGIYSEGFFFALLDDDVLYFKVDGQTISRYRAQAIPQFMNMAYYAVPAAVLDDAELLREWADEALDVARRATSAKTRSKPGKG